MTKTPNKPEQILFINPVAHDQSQDFMVPAARRDEVEKLARYSSETGGYIPLLGAIEALKAMQIEAPNYIDVSGFTQ